MDLPREHFIFRDQPTLGEGEDEFFNRHLSNWSKVNDWLHTSPSLDTLKRAALFEAWGRKRAQILDRILTKIFKLEKELAMEQLMILR